MKTLIINGSLKGDASHSMMVARSFADGLREASDCGIEELELGKLEINHCTGCFGWPEGNAGTVRDKRRYGHGAP